MCHVWEFITLYRNSNLKESIKIIAVQMHLHFSFRNLEDAKTKFSFITFRGTCMLNYKRGVSLSSRLNT